MINLAQKAFWNLFVLWHARHEAHLPFWPLEKIIHIQNCRIRAIVRHAYDTVPFYESVMREAKLRPEEFQTAEDLAKLPTITGEEIAKAPELFVSRRYSQHRLQLITSGTAGYRKSVSYDHRSLMMALAHGHRQRVVLSHLTRKTFSYRELTVGRLNGTGSRLRQFYELHTIIPKRIDFKRAFVEPSVSPESFVEAVNSFCPHVIRGYGSYLGETFRQVYRQGLTLSLPQIVLYGGDRMEQTDRQLIEDIYKVPVVSSYQAVEALRIAYQCEHRLGFHVNLDHIALRIVDSKGNTLPANRTGEVVLSNLTNRATVLLNYKIGDLARWCEGPCGCGRTLPALECIEGRANDLILLSNGRSIHSLIALPPLQAIPGIDRIQLVQQDLSSFSIRCVCSPEASWETIRRQLDAAARLQLGNNIRLKVQKMETLPKEQSGKVRALISHVARTGI